MRTVASIAALGALTALAGFPIAGFPIPRSAGSATSLSDSNRTAGHRCAQATESCTGRLRVPLDWRRPDGPTITISFAWHPRRDQGRPSAGTIFANLGGPHAAVLPPSIYRSTLGDVLDRQDLLLVDPRGHGGSTPLTCPGVDIARPATVRACAQRLGPRVATFGTGQVARDIEAVRSALGISRLSLYGNSYGTLVGLAYAARYPHRVRALYLDSVVATDRASGYATDPLMNSRVFTAGREDLGLLCRRSLHCRLLPGSPVGRLTRLVATLRREPDPKVSLEKLALLHIQLYEPTYGREVNAATNAYLAGDRRPLHRLIGMIESSWTSEPPNPAQAGVLATLCADGRFPFERSASPTRKRQQLNAYYRSERPFAPFTHDEAGVLAYDDYATACVEWPTAQHSPAVPPDADLPDVPVLIVAGDLDTTTPEAGARVLAERFPDATYVQIPSGTHSNAQGLPAAPHTRCVNQLMRRFLSAPQNPIRHPHCDARTFRALGRFPLTADRSMLAAAFATASDAAVRLNPASVYAPALSRQPGLRGGSLRLDHQRRTAELRHTRFVQDIVVHGTIRLDIESRRATAVLTVNGRDRRPHRLRMSWYALNDRPMQRVNGSVDGKAFETVVPAH